MKKYRLLLLVLVVVALTCALTACGGGADTTSDTTTDTSSNTTADNGTATDDSWTKVQEKGELVIGLDDNYPPIGYRDANGELVGSDIDLAKAACDVLGIKPVFKPCEWDGILLTLQNGDIDCIWNELNYTEERAAQINFSRIYMDVQDILITRADSKDINALADLEGKTVGTQLGSSAEESITSDPICAKLKEFRKYGTYTEALLDLQAGRLDAVVTDECNGRYLITSQGMTDSFKVLDVKLLEEPAGVGIKKGNDALTQKINEALDTLAKNGKLKEISQKWFGTDDFIY